MAFGFVYCAMMRFTLLENDPNIMSYFEAGSRFVAFILKAVGRRKMETPYPLVVNGGMSNMSKGEKRTNHKKQFSFQYYDTFLEFLKIICLLICLLFLYYMVVLFAFLVIFLFLRVMTCD